METTYTATVIGGQLQLDESLDMPDNSRVTIILQADEDWREKMKAGLQRLDELRKTSPIHSGGLRFTRDELYERD